MVRWTVPDTPYSFIAGLCMHGASLFSGHFVMKNSNGGGVPTLTVFKRRRLGWMGSKKTYSLLAELLKVDRSGWMIAGK